MDDVKNKNAKNENPKNDNSWIMNIDEILRKFGIEPKCVNKTGAVIMPAPKRKS